LAMVVLQRVPRQPKTSWARQWVLLAAIAGSLATCPPHLNWTAGWQSHALSRSPSRVQTAAIDDAPIQTKKIPFEELNVGDVFEGSVKNRWRTVGVLVDIGAEKNGLLAIEEFEDGFPVGGNKFRLNEHVQVRILEVDNGKKEFFLTRRSGSLDRPPRFKATKPDVSVLTGVSPEQWLDGEITSMSLFGVFVAVEPPSGGETVVGMVHKSEMRQGFASNPKVATRGGQVSVRVLEINATSSKISLSMKDP